MSVYPPNIRHVACVYKGQTRKMRENPKKCLACMLLCLMCVKLLFRTMFRCNSVTNLRRTVHALGGLSASVATILTFGSWPCDRGSPKHKVWPGRGGRAREGGNIRRQENRAGWMEVLIRPTSRAIWLGQQKKKRTDLENKLYSLQIFLWNLSKPITKISEQAF